MSRPWLRAVMIQSNLIHLTIFLVLYYAFKNVSWHDHLERNFSLLQWMPMVHDWHVFPKMRVSHKRDRCNTMFNAHINQVFQHDFTLLIAANRVVLWFLRPRNTWRCERRIGSSTCVPAVHFFWWEFILRPPWPPLYLAHLLSRCLVDPSFFVRQSGLCACSHSGLYVGRRLHDEDAVVNNLSSWVHIK